MSFGRTGDRRGSHIEDGGFMNSGRRGSHIEEIPRNPNVLTPGDNIIRKASIDNPDFGGLQADSKEATLGETTMTFKQAVRLYKKGIMWSVLLSTAIIMEGYDTILLGNFYALPAFLARFHDIGTGTKADPYDISAPWRSGLGNAAGVGEIIGLMATGILQDHFGYKKTIGGALIAVTALLFILFFSINLPMLLAGTHLFSFIVPRYQALTSGKVKFSVDYHG